jgi:allophanate hydrolase subunit 1
VTPRHTIVPAGDSVFIVEFEERIDPAVNASAIALADAMQRAQLAGVRDVVPTYRSVAIYFDPLRTPADALLQRLEAEAARAVVAASGTTAPLRIPVC